MIEHRLIVVGPDRVPRELRLEADSQAKAARVAVARGLRVVSFDVPTGPRPRTRLRDFDLLLFTQELVALLQAGLNVNAALQALAEKEIKPAVRGVLKDIVHELREGSALSACLARRQELFSQVYVAGIRANEQSGGLVNSLTRWMSYQAQVDTLRRKVISASIYPGLLLTVGLAVALFLVGYVVPRFSTAYESAGNNLPLLSQALLLVGLWIDRHVVAFIAGVLVAAAAIVQTARRPAVRARALALIVALPAVRERARIYRLSRLYRTIGLLLLSGIPLAKALQMASDAAAQADRPALDRAGRSLEEGRPLSEALRSESLSTTIADSMIRVGEASGRLGEMLDRAAQFHEDEFARWLDAATRLVEPLLMVIIGLVIGTIVVLMYVPIFELAGSLR